MKLLEKLRAEAQKLPGLAIDLAGGLAGMFLPSDGRSAASYLSDGDWERGFHAMAWNYAGVDTYGRKNNSIGQMFKRATGTKVAILTRAIFKPLVTEGL